jgi:hypothetical protein
MCPDIVAELPGNDAVGDVLEFGLPAREIAPYLVHPTHST